MQRRTGPLFAMFVALLVPACGAEIEQVPGPQPPPPSTSPEPVAELPVAAATTPPPAPAARPPLAELQRDAVKKMLRAINAHEPKTLASMYTDDAVSGVPTSHGWMEDTGKASIEEGHTALFAAFPDMKWASPHVYVKAEVVIQEWQSNATHKGDFGKLKATGKPTGIHGISVYWFDESGAIRRDHTYFDNTTIAQQVGDRPGKPRAIPQLAAAEPVFVTSSGGDDEARRVAAARAMYAAFSGKDEKAFLATLDKDVVQTAYNQPDDRRGQKAAGQGFAAMHRAFSDLKATVVNAWGIGDRVIVEVTTTGTHDGPLGPLKATKKPVTLHSLDVLTLGKDDKITAVESYASTAELLGQISPPSTPAKASTPIKK